MNNRKLMGAAEAVVRINALVKQEGWEITHFVPKPGPYGGDAWLELEIARALEPEDTELAGAARIPQRMLGMTIRELVKKFHDLDGIERYVKMLRDLAEADEKDLAVQEKRLKLAGLQKDTHSCIADQSATPSVDS
jgi:hypothetical protein